MDSSLYSDLLTVLPDWASRLNQLRNRFPDHAGPIAPINPGPPEKRDPRKPRSKSSVVKEEEAPLLQQVDAAAKKLHQKPNTNRARFSSLTGPEILYDGEAQKCLFDCWTALNSNRGHLRKEMMTFKRKRIMALPSANFGYDSDDDLDAGSSDEEEEEETPEAREERLAEAKRKAEEERKKAEIDKARAAVLESIDSRLDKAARACESAAFLWLKGDGCAGHIEYINQRMMEAVNKINHERAIHNAKQPEPLDPGVYSDGDDEDDDAGYVSEEELPHKVPVQRRIPSRPDAAARLQRYRDLGIDS